MLKNILIRTMVVVGLLLSLQSVEAQAVSSAQDTQTKAQSSSSLANLQNTVDALQQNLVDMTQQMQLLTEQNASLQAANQMYEKQWQAAMQHMPLSMPDVNEQFMQTKKVVMDCVQGNCHVTYSAYTPTRINLTIVVVLLILFLIIAWLFTREKKGMTATQTKMVREISGEDVYATKLDLARAYIDMHEPDQAKVLLEEVIKKGNADQQAEAKKLLALCTA